MEGREGVHKKRKKETKTNTTKHTGINYIVSRKLLGTRPLEKDGVWWRTVNKIKPEDEDWKRFERSIIRGFYYSRGLLYKRSIIQDIVVSSVM